MNTSERTIRLVDSHGKSYPLRGREIQLGRARDNEIIIQDAQVSRYHATVFVQEGKPYLRDEKSANGTWLNGQRVSRAVPLHVGDHIRIGGAEFVVKGAVDETRRAPVLPVAPSYAMPARQTRALPFVVIGVVATAAICFIAIVIPLMRFQPSRQAQIPASPVVASPTALSSLPTATTDVADFKLPPPLANVDFPAQAIAYPSDWPSELRYPDSFRLVDVASGVLPQSNNKGWVVKLLYAGNAGNASAGLVSFFASNGWQIVERTPLDAGGFLLIVQRGNKPQSGLIVVDPDQSRPGQTRIMIAVSL